MSNYHIKHLEEYYQVYRKSVRNPESFWEEIAEEHFMWRKKWDKVLNWDFTKPEIKWFEGAKLNITENCIDRHLYTRGDKTAIILGATGLTGGLLLQLLLRDDRYADIKVFTRSPLRLTHPKLTEIQCDLLTLENQEADFTADEVFCCIGTTKANTPDKELYKAIDYGIPVAAASLCKKNEIPTFLVVSAMVSSILSPISAVKLNPPSAVFFKKSLLLSFVKGLSISACRCAV
jgi:hypothetical protein